MKKRIIFIIAIILLIGAGFLLLPFQDQEEQNVQKLTYDISKEYLLLRYRTDNLLVNAKEYTEYSIWANDMTKLIEDWNKIEKNSNELETSATKTAEKSALNFKILKTATAYTAKEISGIYDKAPRFKGIATLANHLGVDAKRAQLILNQAQAQINSDVFIEEGDAFETLENTAIVVKDGCKVVGFVGTAGTLGTAAAVVVGVDLALEVTEDGAQIAMGDRNKVSSFVKDVRTVTEPIANIITITNIPNNLGTAFGKFDGVMMGLEQFREAAQEGKVVGVDLTNFEYKKPFQRIRQAQYPGTITVAEMEMAEVEAWLKSLNKESKPMTQEEIEEFLKQTSENTKQEQKTVEDTKQEQIPVEEVKESNTNQSSNPKKGTMSYNEWDDWGDAASRYKEDLIEKFGNADITETKGGKEMWVYKDLVYYTSGRTCSPMYTFYETDQVATRKCETMENVESIVNYVN